MRRHLVALLTHLRTEHTSPARIGVAVGLGVWVGTLPFYGFHAVLAVGLAVALGLNKVTVALASSWSIPPLAPLILATGLAIGEAVRYGRLRAIAPDEAALALVGDRFVSVVIGDALLGLALGAAAGLGAHRWAQRSR